jgi:short-subunit dehydrogenase
LVVASAERPGALIVGASSGIGAALARQLGDAGWRVALVARRGERIEALASELSRDTTDEPAARAYLGDVTAYDAAPALFARIANEMAPLRLVVYVAGIMPHTTTGTSFADERAMVETNVLGAMSWLGLAAEHFESTRAGTIVGVSSVAGDRGRPGNGAYQAAKGALSIYLDALRFRLAPAGVRVVTIKPGYVATAMTAGLRMPRRLTVSPEAVARAIVRASRSGPTVAYVPGYWRAIMWTVRLLPAGLVARLPG